MGHDSPHRPDAGGDAPGSGPLPKISCLVRGIWVILGVSFAMRMVHQLRRRRVMVAVKLRKRIRNGINNNKSRRPQLNNVRRKRTDNNNNNIENNNNGY